MPYPSEMRVYPPFRLPRSLLAPPFCALAALLFTFSHAPADEASKPLVYESDVRAIFVSKCGSCHGDRAQKAELKLTDAASLLRGGESGRVVVAGKPNDSLLWELVAAEEMPPENAKRLTDREKQVLRDWIAGGARVGSPPTASPERQESFYTIAPLLFRRCTACHGPEYQQGGLDARTRETLLRGGGGGPGFIAGDSHASHIVRRVVDNLCPPQADIGEAGIEPMTRGELDQLKAWIDAGAPAGLRAKTERSQVAAADRRHWAFQPPRRSATPQIEADQRSEMRNAVDAFVLRKLADAGLSWAAPADRLTLIRRVSFDLTGLPPDEELVDRFLSDSRPGAWERVVDQLLASPRYGERWSRFWLDLAGYADSEGKRHADLVRPYAYRYRDYVIRSHNDDQPFDEFLREQLAGDEMVDYSSGIVSAGDLQKLIATGFLRMAPDGTSADPVNRFSDRVEVIADELDILTRGVLGLSMKCSRCHSHKYDPLPQRDYYRLVAVFRGAYDEYDWLTPQPFGNQWNKAKRRHLEVATRAERDDWDAAKSAADKRVADLQKQIKATQNDKQRLKQLQTKLKNVQAAGPKLPKVRALWDRGRPSPTYVYRRGDELQPTHFVEPGVPEVLENASLRYGEPQPTNSLGTGRRLRFAEWLTHAEHPLTARVAVNRIWAQHFGAGIVRSLDEFGAMGEQPSHPQLLDWLAVEFRESGYSRKHIHRLIATSRTYRQRSQVASDVEEKDPENRLLSRMPLRRLDAEQLRDSLLLVSGQFSERAFGKPDDVEVRGDGLVTAKPTVFGFRRSVYVRQRRKEMPSLLETFDLPQMNPNCLERRSSTVVSQPLQLLHGKFVYQLAGQFAARIQEHGGGGARVAEQLAAAWRLAYSRPIRKDELQVALNAHLEVQENWEQQSLTSDEAGARALRDFCHMLLNSAEFLYVD